MQPLTFAIFFLSVITGCLGNTTNTNLGASPTAANDFRVHTSHKDIDVKIGDVQKGNVTRDAPLIYWFTGIVNGNFDNVTINVHSSIDDRAGEQQIRFEVHCEQFQEQPSRSWLLPMKAVDGNGAVYHESNKTLCTNSQAYKSNDTESQITVRLSVSTLSTTPLNFSVHVFFGETNMISNLTANETSFDLVLFSPAYFKLKINQSDAGSSPYALLEIKSTDNICITVALQSPECPLLEKERNAKLGRHLTMSGAASMTIEMSDLVQGRFLVFIMHQDDSKCNTTQCNECWKEDIILPLDDVPEHRIKRLSFTLRSKITDKQYLVTSLFTIGIFMIGFLSLLFPITLCTIKSVQERRGSIADLVSDCTTSGQCGDEDELIGSTDENGRLMENDSSPLIQTEVDYLFGCIKRNFGGSTCTDIGVRSTDAKRRNARRYFGTLLVNAIFYILPAVQLIWIYQRVFKLTGNEDLCYYNFRCLHPLLGFVAFNHLLSNVGYIILGLLFCIVVCLDTNDRPTGGIFMAMGIALGIQGVMSALYHTCPNHISFQFDTCFMYITAMLCWVIVFQGQNPETTASVNMTYAVVAVAVALGVAAVVSEVWYFWFCITAVHLFICFVFSFQLDSIRGKFTWNFILPCKLNREEFVLSFWRPLRTWTGRKIFLVAYNIFNWIIALALLLTLATAKTQDYASYLLMVFIFNLLAFSCAYVYMKLKERIVSWQTWAYLFATIPVWFGAFYFYFQNTASWGLSPAESRMLNKDCTLLGFFDHHDIWHFLSAFGMFLNFMFFFTLDDATPLPCPQTQQKSVSNAIGDHPSHTHQDENEEVQINVQNN